MAAFIHCCGYRAYVPCDPSAALVKFHDDGSVTLYTGESDMGQGAHTALAMIAAEELGVNLEDITVVTPDTSVTPLAMGSFASRVTLIGGNAVKAAAADAKRQLLEVASEMLEVAVADLEAKLIQSALDLGANGVQVPQIETAEQAYSVVRFSHFPPVGERGFGSTTRAAGYGFRPRPLVIDSARQELLVSIQIESKAGVDNLPGILETEGIDVVFIGTSDLSMSYGYDSPNDPAMLPLVEKLVSAVNSAGKISGLYLSDWSKIEYLQKLGVRYFTVAAAPLIKDDFTSQVKDFADRVKLGS